jgi:putative transposase
MIVQLGMKLLGRGDMIRTGNDMIRAENDMIRAGNGMIRAGNGMIRAGNGMIRAGNGMIRAGNGMIRAGVNPAPTNENFMYNKPKFNPHIHHRRSIRLKGFDYSQAGLYFITICCQDRFCHFGHVENDAMILNEYGQIAFDEWMKLPERFPNFELDVFQIMPNHIHAIISLTNSATAAAPVRATLAVAPNGNAVAPNGNAGAHDGNTIAHDAIGAGVNPARTGVSDIVGAYKSLVSNVCLKIFKSKNEMMGKLWQRNYYEHIIRNEQSYQRIAEYIMNNPIKWHEDKFYNIE